MQVYQNLLQQAQGVSATPYNPYGGQLVAPVNPEQGAGIANINAYAGAAQPYLQTAEGMAMNAASPITTSQIQQYMSPYTNMVVNATEGQFANQNAEQMQGVKGNAIAQGALGGNREGIAEAETANQQNLAQAPVIANLENTGYQTALTTAEAQKQAQAAGAYSVGNLGVAGQTAGLTGANAQIGAGTLQQQTQQADLTSQYQQFLNQQAYPFQTTQWLAGLGTGVGSQMGGTSQTTAPAPSLLGQIFGGLSSGAGMLGASGAFPGAATATTAATPGWMAGLGSWFARGGGVASRAEGGGVANHEVTMPETPHTLIAQQHQLLQGHRRAQLFPHGTSELPLPHGMARATTEAGAIHYNPHHINAETVHHLASGGRLNELLDLGPVTKDEAMRRIHEGEHPVAIVERNEAGHEVRAALGTHLTALDQMHAMHRTKSPGHTLTLEHPDHVVARRIHHQMSGGVANRDTGGGVNYQTFGGGFGTPVVPYSGGKSWVPSMGITHGQGHGAPPPPNSPGQPQSDLNSQMKNIGSLAGAIHSGMNQPTTLGDNGLGSTNDPSWTGGDPLAGGAAIGTSGVGGAKRGGGISNYADGGTPNFNDRFTGVDPGVLPPTIDGVPTQLLLGKGGFDPPGATPNVNDRFNGEDSPPSGVLPPKVNEAPGAPTPTSPTLTREASTSEPTPASEGVAEATPLPPERPVTGIDDAPDRSITRATPTGGYAGNMDSIAAAHRQIESGNNYQSVGPLITHKHPDGTVTTDHAYGAYQVTGQNIPNWTKEILGQSLTPAQFLGNKEAQDAVYKAKMGQYINQVGLDGAVHKWLGPGAKDNTTGVSQGEYLNRFKTALGMPQTDSTEVASSSDAADIPSKATLTQAKGVAPNIDWSANSKLWPALMSAGFGMLASRSPFPSVAFGQGAEQGMQTYGELRQQELAQHMGQAKLDLEARRLSQEADFQQKKIGVEMMPYSGAMTAKDKLEAAYHNAQLEQEKYKANITARQPYKYMDAQGAEHVLLPRPAPDGTIEWYHLDPKTGAVDSSPVGKGLPGANPQSNSTGEGFQPPSQNQGGFQQAQYDPNEGIIQHNNKLIASGSADYSQGAPYVEKGMDVPPPKDTAGRSPQAIQTDAEYYLQTGKLPPVRAGRSPVAVQQNNYRNAVQNYGNVLATSRGSTPEQLADAWRTAPGMLRFVLGADGRSTVALGTAVRHLDTIQELGKAWAANDTQTVNRLRAVISREFGSDAATNLTTAGKIVGPEIIKAIGIAGAGTAEEREAAEKAFSAVSSPQQLLGAAQTTQKLLGGQLEGRRRQAANAGVSEERFKSLIGDRPYEILSHLGGAGTSAAGAPATPGAAPAAPAAQRQLTPADQSALTWANANSNDPRAAAIRQRLGTQ